MSQFSPCYIVPLLVEQPTWGGQYIAACKRITHEDITTRNIGQSFELYDHSWVSFSPMTEPGFAWATATQLNQPTFVHVPTDIQTLQSVIAQSPQAILGKKGVKQFGNSMQALIKLTQAKNNSYQVHVQPDKAFGSWEAKPESWYYLEDGKATLGVNMRESLTAYQQRCQAIEAYAHSVSKDITSGTCTLDAGKEKLHTFIEQNHPRKFVNTVFIRKGQVIDLSAGGIHHSWETDPSLPEGNIVYEVQKNVMDDRCTLRSFDQGSIKNDGSVRPITVDDYFKALDTTPAHNDPSVCQQEPASHQDQGATVTPLFLTPNYALTQLDLDTPYGGQETETHDSFHHLYLVSGSAEIVTAEGHWPIRQGWSLFIPAAVEGYQITPLEPCRILKTFLA